MVNEFGQVLPPEIVVLRGVMRLVASLVSSESVGEVIVWHYCCCMARSCSWEGVHACVDAVTSLAAGAWWNAPTLNEEDGCSLNCWFIIIIVLVN